MKTSQTSQSVVQETSRTTKAFSVNSACLRFAFVCALLFAGCSRHHDLVKVESPYHEPLNSPGTKFSALPLAVQNSIRAETGSAQIADIIKDTTSGEPIYQVHFVYNPPLYLKRDGTVLNPDMTVAVGASGDNIGISKGSAIFGLKSSDLPQNVMKVVHDRAPNSEIAFISKETWDEREVYIISFKDSAHNPSLYIASDGSLVTGLRK